MPVDTQAERCSAIATRRLPWFRRFWPIPDGTMDSADRAQLGFVYNALQLAIRTGPLIFGDGGVYAPGGTGGGVYVPGGTSGGVL